MAPNLMLDRLWEYLGELLSRGLELEYLLAPVSMQDLGQLLVLKSGAFSSTWYEQKMLKFLLLTWRNQLEQGASWGQLVTWEMSLCSISPQISQTSPRPPPPFAALAGPYPLIEKWEKSIPLHCVLIRCNLERGEWGSCIFAGSLEKRSTQRFSAGLCTFKLIFNLSWYKRERKGI